MGASFSVGPDPAGFEPGGPVDPLAADAAAVAVAVQPGGRLRWPVSLLTMGIALLLLTLAGTWAQDVLAPFVNEGEADIAGTVTFEASEGRYRVVTSGPSRPEARRTACDVVDANGRSVRIRAGDDSDTTRDRLGVSRVIVFDAIAGPTSVTCIDEIAPSFTGGRFQVVDADGSVSVALTVTLVAGLVSLLGGAVWSVLRYRRAAAR